MKQVLYLGQIEVRVDVLPHFSACIVVEMCPLATYFIAFSLEVVKL